MSNIIALDAVIRRIEKKEQLLPTEVLVEISTKSNNVFSKFFSNTEKYAVSTVQVASCRGITHRLFNSIPIEVSFEASIPTGNEKKVAESLYKGATLEAELNNNVSKWVADFARLYSEDQIFDLRSDLEDYIAKTSLQEIGMHLKVDVTYKGNVDSITIKSNGGFAVRVMDFDQQVFVRFETELLVLDKTTALLTSKRTGELQKVFTDIIRDYFPKNVELHQYCFELEQKIKETLIGLFNKATKPLGREVGFLSLTADSYATLVPSPNISPMFEHQVQADIKGFSSKIIVKNRTLFEIYNIGKFKSAKITNLETWFRQTITAIVRDTLFDLTYKELLLNRYKYEDLIKFEIGDKAQAIGYKIKQHIVIPDLVELKLVTEGVKVDFSGNFATSDSRVSIKLQIYVRGRFEEEALQELDERYMAPTANINKAIEEAIKDRIQEKAHSLAPEQMYMKFEDFEDGRNSVRNQLEESIKELLVDQFKISSSNLTVNLKQKDNELTFSTKQFSLDFKPMRGEGEEMKFDVRFKISRVMADGWGIFQKNLKKTADEELTEIQHVLSEHLKDVLSSIPHNYLISTDFKVKSELKRRLDAKVFQETSKEFGLLIELVTFNRNLTVYEEQTLALQEFKIIDLAKTDLDSTTKLNELTQKRLLELYEKRDSIFDIGEDDDLARLDEEIKKVEGRISTESFNATNLRNTYLNAGSKGSFSFDDEPLSLKEGDNSEQTE
jgi:hypothetical protein